MNPLDALSGLGDINALTGGAASALLPPPFGTDTSVAPNAPGAAQIVSGDWWGAFQNVGMLLVGILVFLLGMGLLMFAWGEHIAGTVENVMSKIPPVVPV